MRMSVLIFLLIRIGTSCIQRNESKKNIDFVETDTTIISEQNDYSDTTFVSMNDYAVGFFYDMRYAGANNFLKQKVYECDECLLRREVADALIAANNKLKTIGLRIKFFDCYRPLDVQRLMWEIFPNGKYVANPHTTGSIHNRGGAVDITLVDKSGNELDMGTAFDFFGLEAHHTYKDLPDTVLANRKLLKSTMESFSFSSISSEWWHYNFSSSNGYTLSNFKPNCNKD